MLRKLKKTERVVNMGCGRMWKIFQFNGVSGVSLCESVYIAWKKEVTMKTKRMKVIGVILSISIILSTLADVPVILAKDYTDGGCVQWVKDRAKEKLGITLPATGSRPTGKYAALNYWTILPEQGYIKSATPRKDSLAVWDGGIGDYAGYGHVAFVEEVNGNQVYLSEGGYAGGNQGNGVNIGWWDANNLNRPKSGQTFLGYIYLTNSPSLSGLSYTEIKTEFVDTWNAGLYGYIDNPDRIQLSEVGAYVWDEAGALVVNHRENCTLSTSYVNQQLNIVGEALPTGLRSGASYTYQLYAVANGTEYKSAVGCFTVVDDQKPEISNVVVSNQSETGYTISCKVTDNYQVDRVQFPTWTKANGQDDIAADWGNNSLVRGTKNGDIYTYRVNISDHNNEKGVYRTHIYAFDKAGNSICVPIEDVIIAEEVVASPIPAVPTQKPNDEEKKEVYTWQGRFTGWGGPNSYPSSMTHAQGDGKNNVYYIGLTNIGFTSGYGCGLELMNPYSPYLQGTDNEMAQFIKKMKNPRIKVTLENGGAASSWNWDTELSFPSGKGMALPDGYLDTGYFALFGNDDVITKVEFYDAAESGGSVASMPNPTNTLKPENTANPSKPTNSPVATTNSEQESQSSSTIDTKKETKKIIQNPGRVKIKKLNKDGRGCAKITWGKVKCNDGYQIQYSRKRNFSRKETKTSNSKSTYILGKSKKTYYVRVRAVNYGWTSQSKHGYKYGKWSKVRKIRMR